jgi:hypothetical protein
MWSAAPGRQEYEANFMAGAPSRGAIIDVVADARFIVERSRCHE